MNLVAQGPFTNTEVTFFLLINLFAVLRSHRGLCHEGTPVLAVVEILFKISMIGVSLLRSISYVGHKSSCVYIYYVPQTL